MSHRHAERIAMAARNLRMCADSLQQNGSKKYAITSVIHTLQATISLLSLCLFNQQQDIIQNAKHDFDGFEIREANS